MEYPKIEINMLPSNEGDCLHIRFRSGEEWHNIVIDSGPSACASQFRALMDRVRKQQEYVDLLCFSHIDDDHIKGAELTFSELSFNSSHIKQIWINLPDSVTSSTSGTKLSDYQNITVESAYKIFSYITARNIPCKTKVTAGDQMTIGDILITAVLPTPQRLEAYFKTFERELERLRQSKPYLFVGGTASDTSPYNASSISLMINADAGKLLFAGDAFASDLAAAAQSYVEEEGFLLVKLPHHGSERNISKDMLESLRCQYFLISTQSTAQRPAQKTVDLLAEYGKEHGGVGLYGNYVWPFIRKPDQGIEIQKLPTREKSVAIGEVILFTEG